MKRFVALCFVAVALATAPAFSADYQKGRDAYVDGDYKTALAEWKPLAEHGHAEAQFYLGWMYKHGWGVVQHYVRAHMWFNIGASNGSTNAPGNRDEIAEKMTPTQIEKAQDLAYECVAKDYKGC